MSAFKGLFCVAGVAVVLVASLGCATSQHLPPECEGFSPVPSDLDGAVEAVLELLPPEELAEFGKLPESEATAAAHFGLGLGMRNCWGLWAGSDLASYFNNLGIDHPDDMSGIVLTSLWRDLNGKPRDLKAQIEYYQDYWAERKESATQTSESQ